MRISKRGVLVLTMLWATFGGGCRRSADPIELPETLLGRWETSAPKYADRYFEFRADGNGSDSLLILGLGGRLSERSPITKVDTERDGDFLNYHISHLNETGDVFVFSLIFNPRRPDEVALLNQSTIVWTRNDDSSVR